MSCPSEYVSKLKQQVEKTFGRKVLSFTDCRYLYEDISQRFDSKISFNTLRRFFCLMYSPHQPSVYTLDVLASYCGFTSFEDFVTCKQHCSLDNNQSSILLNYLNLIFRNTEVSGSHDRTYCTVVQQTIHYLENHPYLVDQFQREIARTTNGQTYYFERFINIDKLNAYYGKGLTYYLAEKKTAEAQLFGHTLLCFSHWLTCNKEGVEEHYKKIMQVPLVKTIAPSAWGRYFECQLLYAHAFGKSLEPLLHQARQYYVMLSPSKENSEFLFQFEFVLSHTLILTGHYDEALFYINMIINKRKEYTTPCIEVSLLDAVYIFQAIAYAATNNRIKAKEVFDTINPNNFYFLAKQYLTILYLFVKEYLYKKSIEPDQLHHLIQVTGFKRLLHLWEFTQQPVAS